MTNIKKVILFLGISLFSIILTPNFSKATEIPVTNEDTFRNAVETATNGDTIVLNNDISLTKNIGITDKVLIIKGNGHTISKDTISWTDVNSDGSLITAGKGATITLENLSLKNAHKYGAQAYNGGHLILNKVTISNCGFGGILANAGTVEIIELTLNKNGENDNVGIEIAKGKSLPDSENNPEIIMNGILSSTQEENVIYIAVEDNLAEFEITNTENTVNKILSSGDKIVVTDKNNNIIYESNSGNSIKIAGEDFIPNVIIIFYLNEQSSTASVIKGSVLTKEQLKEKVDLQALNLTDYTIDGFYTDQTYTNEYDYALPIDDNISLYAKLTPIKKDEPEKDTSPKTGVNDYLEISALVLIASILGAIALRRDD